MTNSISNPSKLWNNPDPITCIVIGAGGTGSQVLNQLAKINAALKGLERPGLTVITFDNDIVSETNIGRQLFSPSDIGHPKAKVLVERINRFYGTQWIAIPELFNSQINYSANIIITCVDSIKSRKEIYSIKKFGHCFNDTNMDRLEYFIDTGNDKDYGQIVFWNDYPHNGKKKISNVFNIFGTPKKESSTPSCSMAEALSKQNLFINSTIANYTGVLVWQMLTLKELSYQGIVVNLKTLKTNPIPIKWK